MTKEFRRSIEKMISEYERYEEWLAKSIIKNIAEVKSHIKELNRQHLYTNSSEELANYIENEKKRYFTSRKANRTECLKRIDALLTVHMGHYNVNNRSNEVVNAGLPDLNTKMFYTLVRECYEDFGKICDTYIIDQQF